MHGAQQNKGKGAGYAATGLTSLKTGLTGSSRVLQNKAKSKMVKPKKPEIGIWKTVEAKAVESIRRKSRSPFLESFWLNPKNKIMMLVGLKIPSKPNLFQNKNSMIGICNWVILTCQCCFHHMDHLYMCHVNFVLICIILILHGLIIRICHSLLYIFVQIISHIRNRQLKAHHLPAMTVLIIKSVYAEKDK